MRLLHTSDWHLGMTDSNISLYDDQKYFIDEICRLITEEKIDAVMIAGDVYDRSIASSEAVKLYDYAMTRICAELKTPVLEVAGNHDSAERLSTCGELLKASGLHVTGALTDKPSVVEIGNAQIFMIPWISEPKVKSIYPDKADVIKDITDAYRVVTDACKEEFKEGVRHIVIAHAFIANCETSTSDRAAVVGFATQVDPSVFDGFDYVALGHLHRPHDVNSFIRYSGTPMPYSFGAEEKQTKSVTIIDTESMEHSIITLPLLHQRRTIEGTWDEVIAPDLPDEVKDGYVLVNVTDEYIGLSRLNELRNVYKNLLGAGGKSFEGEGSEITLSIEQLDEIENDPIELFKHFCRDNMGLEPEDHLVDLFTAAVKKAEEGEA